MLKCARGKGKRKDMLKQQEQTEVMMTRQNINANERPDLSILM